MAWPLRNPATSIEIDSVSTLTPCQLRKGFLFLLNKSQFSFTMHCWKNELSGKCLLFRVKMSGLFSTNSPPPASFQLFQFFESVWFSHISLWQDLWGAEPLAQEIQPPQLVIAPNLREDCAASCFLLQEDRAFCLTSAFRKVFQHCLITWVYLWQNLYNHRTCSIDKRILKNKY